jgi:hypothetical protein
MSNRTNFYLGQLVTEADLDSIQTNLESGTRQAISDNDISGVVEALGVSQVGLGTTLSVEIAGPGAAYDGLGRRIYLPAAEQVDLSQDENAVSTTVVGGGNERYISVFIEYDEILSNPQLDNNGTTVFVDIAESYTIRVIQEAEAAAGTASRPALLPNAILLADVLIANGTTGIVDAMIESDDASSTTSRFQWAFSATSGTPTQIRSRTINAFAGDMVGALNNHINSVGTAHPLSAISFSAASVPARFSNTAAATDAQGAIDAMLVDLPNETAAIAGSALVPNGTYSIGQSGVVQGLIVTAPGGGTTVSISPGLAIKWSAVGVSTPISVNTTQVVDLAATFDGLDLWACIELDTSSGAIVTTAGTPAVAPTFPTGSTSRIPLAYVYLDAGLGTIAATDVVRSRPMLSNKGLGEGLWKFEQGQGGIDVSALGTEVETAPVTAISPDGLTIATPAYTAFDLNATTNLWVTGESYGAMAATDDVVYLYAAMPSYPAGYDADVQAVQRELITTGTRIDGALHNAILVASIATTPGNSPAGDPGSLVSNNPLFGAHPASLYLGAVAHRNAGNLLRPQTSAGATVTLTGGFSPRSSTVNIAGSSTLDFSRVTPATGTSNQLLPVTTGRALFGIQYAVDPATAGSVQISSQDSNEPYFDMGVQAGSANTIIAGQAWIDGVEVDYSFIDGGAHFFIVWASAYQDRILWLR